MRCSIQILLLIIGATPIVGLTQVGLPEKSRQNQFIWEKSSTPFIGLEQNALDSIFQSVVQSQNAITLALSLRTDSIPEEWSSIGPICDPSAVNLSCSHRYIQPGSGRFMLPTSLVPEAFSSGEWTLVINGEEWPLTPGIIIHTETSANAEAVTIGLRLELNNVTYERHLLLPVLGASSCPEPDLPPWPAVNENDPHWVGIFDNGETVTGQALVKIGTDGQFDRPLILLEGFDPNIGGHTPMYGFGDLNWEVIWNCDGTYNESLGGLGSMLESFLQEGFDLVFLDFEDGTRSIFQQAKLLQHVLEQCRDYRVASDPLVVVGPSMGGIVAREALRSMELEGIDHCVRLFAALDSPFRGAYLPIALQEAIAFFSEFSVDSHLLFQALLSPAASELLVGSPFHSSNIRSNLEAHQQQHGLPTRCMNIAVANSNPNVPNAAPALWYSATESFLGWDYVNIHLHGQPGNLTHPETEPDAPVIFEASLLNPSWGWGDPLVLDGMAWTDIDLFNFENLPGGTSTHMAKFKEALSLVGIEPDAYTSTSVYVPALSALDVPFEYPLSPTDIRFDHWSTEPVETSPAPHCNINQHLEFLWSHIVNGQPLMFESNSTDSIFCLGWQNPTQQMITGAAPTAESTGSIEIGTGFCNGPGEWPLFTCETSPCSPVIYLPEGRTMRIGDSMGDGASHAQFTIARGGTLVVNGTVHIGPHSTLLIEEGAELILEEGTLRVDPFGSIVQRPHSRIKTIGNGRIFLNGADAIWTNEGVVHLHSFDSLRVASELANQCGKIKFYGETGYTFLGDHSVLQIDGSPIAAVELILAEDAKRGAEGSGTCKLNHVNLHFHNNAEWHVGVKSRYNEVNANGYTPHHKLSFHNRMRWQGGTLQDMEIKASNGGIAGAILQNLVGLWCKAQFSNTGIRLDHCDFDHTSVQCENIEPHSWVAHCSFLDGWTDLPQLEVSESQSTLFLEENRFENHDIGLRLFHAQSTASCNAWEGNDTGVVLDTLSRLDAKSPYGKNEWIENGIHIQCHSAYMPLFQSGANQFGDANDALLLGTLHYPMDGDLTTGDIPHVVVQNGNMWPNATVNAPYMVPYLGLESSIDGASIHFLDPHPSENSCTLFTENQSDSNPKRDVLFESDTTSIRPHIFPNPANEKLHIHLGQWGESENLQFVIFDATGKRVYSSRATESKVNGVFTIPLQQLDIGWYTIHINVNGYPRLQKPFIIER
ncbi:MAG: hypothetical protein CL828_02385 [Crocinitomicaceae bacterium]|nr:hypothetical protein [Crocinitomicaceae bacterium]